jgi:hypothetical protein
MGTEDLFRRTSRSRLPTNDGKWGAVACSRSRLCHREFVARAAISYRHVHFRSYEAGGPSFQWFNAKCQDLVGPSVFGCKMARFARRFCMTVSFQEDRKVCFRKGLCAKSQFPRRFSLSSLLAGRQEYASGLPWRPPRFRDRLVPKDNGCRPCSGSCLPCLLSVS